MKKLYIISAGDFGREVLEWAMAMPACGREWEVAGFLDSRKDILKEHRLPVGIVGNAIDWRVGDDQVFVCAIGNPVQKSKYATLFREQGGRFINIVHPTVIMGANSRMGVGCILCPHVTITVNVTIGDFVVMNCFASAGHDAVIGEGSTLNSHSDVTGRARLGKCVLMGSHASVLPGAVVGDHAVVGAGSVVLRKVAAHTTVFGVPAIEIPKAKG